MDQTKQVYESETTGWQRGLYADIRQTAGLVGSIWRSVMYYEPEFLQYAWGQLKPIFQTREFAAFEIAWRDTLVSATEPALPRYSSDDVGLNPSEFSELQGQLACYDLAVPCYLVIFEMMDRLLDGREVGTETPNEAGTAPYPKWLNRERGRQPMKLPNDEARKILQNILPDDHLGGLEGMVPTGYRSWARWPSYLEQVWMDIEPLVGSDDFKTAREDAQSLITTFVDRVAYTPKVDPKTLTAMRYDQETVVALQKLFATFNSGAFDFVTLVPVYAATLDSLGERHALTFP